MKAKELSILVSRTFNLGNFESLRVEAGMSVSIEGYDGDLEEGRAKMLLEIHKSLSAAYQAHRPKKSS